MKPAPFHYHAPRALEECLELLARYGPDGKILAGGQSLMPMMNFRLARPAALIDANNIAGLDQVTLEDGLLRVGALTRQRRLERDSTATARVALLREALPLVGHVAIRNRGTVGGSVAHADPAAELPAILVCLGGSVVASSCRGCRTVAAEAFFTGPLSTILEPDEMVTEVCFPIPRAGSGSAFLEVARRHGDFALVGAVAVVRVTEEGRVREFRLAIFGAGPVPSRYPKAEGILLDAHVAPERVAEVRRAITASVTPDSDIHATADYRRRVAGVLAERAIGLALGRCVRKGAA